MGQDKAVRHVANILKRLCIIYQVRSSHVITSVPKAYYSLQELRESENWAYKIRYCTKLVFGSPINYIRFDISEFSHDNADQRLVGTLSGYVGYDVGGELTNAIKQNPFLVVLFNEIEKANP